MMSVKFPPPVKGKKKKDEDIMGIITDDGEALEILRKTNKLPQNRYQSLSVLIDDTRRPPISQNEALFQFGSYDVKTRLHPPVSNLGTFKSTKTSVIQGPPLRIPPVPFDEMFPPIDSGRPARHPHNGTVYPVSHASEPPYTSPGYDAPGIKQPVGVVRLPKVKAKPSMGWAMGAQVKLPTWVSPLYKPYGIAGPYGPNGPFYRAPMETCEPHIPRGIRGVYPLMRKYAKKIKRPKFPSISFPSISFPKISLPSFLKPKEKPPVKPAAKPEDAEATAEGEKKEGEKKEGEKKEGEEEKEGSIAGD